MPRRTAMSLIPISGTPPILLLLAAALALAGCASLEAEAEDTASVFVGRNSLGPTAEEEFPEAARNCQLPQAVLSRAGSYFVVTLPADIYAARGREPAATRIACLTRWAGARGLTFTLGSAR